MTAPARRSQKARAQKVEPFWWFGAPTVRELYDRLGAAGPDTARLEVHLSGKKMTLEVIADSSTASRIQPLNDSHVCPPICPH